MVGAILAVIVAIGAFPVQVSDVPSSPVLNASRFTLPSLAAAVPTAGAEALTVGPVPLTVLAPDVQVDALAQVDNHTEATLANFQADQAAGSAPQASVDGGDSDEKIPIFFEYEVKAGDTLGAIADHFGIGVDYIVWNNVDVQDANDINPGMILQIPSVEGMIHSVKVDETVTQIARTFDADWRDIVEFRANGLAGDPNNIQPGTQILVPGGRPAPLLVEERPGSDQPPPTNGWMWPTQGVLTSPFGPAHPLGIDVAAPIGTPLHASAAGTVTFVGGNPCCSYGYHVIVDHGNGYETLYAHLKEFAVEVGSVVNQGDIVGYIGVTGKTTGPHVHFELRRNGVYQNPLLYLP